ncbi:MAG: DNA-3-methyladenine glycosylase 2 family protein [Actinobacteria bacterium]|nr:DNA-3-methyladenine glycosylase 2 family protein [Actinomycetota bacterium]
MEAGWPSTGRESGTATFTEAELPGLCEALAARDPDLRRVVEAAGYPPFWSRPNTFESLVWFILEQQVSLASARAALEKLRALVGTISPETVRDLTEEELRAASFSRQKAGYVGGLAAELTGGGLDLRSLEALPDAEVRRTLTRIRGVGNWTADVYLIMVLHRTDVFPGGDLAAVNGLKHLKGLPRSASTDEVSSLAEKWAPLRTVATMLVWHDYLARRSPPSTVGGPGTRDSG